MPVLAEGLSVRRRRGRLLAALGTLWLRRRPGIVAIRLLRASNRLTGAAIGPVSRAGNRHECKR
jgi:hypothetical protein